MASEKGRPLPKFGEWDVNNPASAEGFTVIFNKARDDKKTNTNTSSSTASAIKLGTTPRKNENNIHDKKKLHSPKSRWFCCC